MGESVLGLFTETFSDIQRAVAASGVLQCPSSSAPAPISLDSPFSKAREHNHSGNVSATAHTGGVRATADGFAATRLRRDDSDASFVSMSSGSARFGAAGTAATGESARVLNQHKQQQQQQTLDVSSLLEQFSDLVVHKLQSQ